MGMLLVMVAVLAAYWVSTTFGIPIYVVMGAVAFGGLFVAWAWRHAAPVRPLPPRPSTRPRPGPEPWPPDPGPGGPRSQAWWSGRR